MKRWLILSTVVCLVLSGAATAAVQQGDTELSFTAGFIDLNGDDGPMGEDYEQFFIEAGLGYFMTDNWQAGVSAGGSWAEEDDTDLDAYSFGLFAKYHFMPTNQWVPYVGAQIDWVDAEEDAPGSVNDEDFDGIQWGPLVGLRYELNAYNDFFVQYEYRLYDGDLSDVYDDGHALLLGIVHQFK